MNNRYKLMLDFINLHGRVVVNHRGCLSINKTPELKWLLKKGHIKQGRVRKTGGIGWTYVYPLKPYEVKSLICPECGSNLYKLHPEVYFGPRHKKHEIDCSLRLHHGLDTQSHPHIIFDPKWRKK